jgi:serine/threonine protein kinase
MKAEIQRRCANPHFSLIATLSKKEKLKEAHSELEDFFRRIFVVDSKKRMTFSNIVKHPLFADYEIESKDNLLFYNKFEKTEAMFKDEPDRFEFGADSEMEPED